MTVLQNPNAVKWKFDVNVLFFVGFKNLFSR